MRARVDRGFGAAVDPPISRESGKSGKSGEMPDCSRMFLLMHPYRRSEPLGWKREVKFHDVQGENQGEGPGDLEATERGLVPVVQRFKVL